MHFVKFSYPSIWTMMLSLNILAVVVIGGLRSIYGTVIGALIVFAVPDLLLKRIPVIGKIDGIAYIFTGVLIILVVMFYPNGVVGLCNDIIVRCPLCLSPPPCWPRWRLGWYRRLRCPPGLPRCS
ncbi:ABC transporter permease subunit, partial [Pseudoflavonifractor phocaeensis]|uniref:ABC transporter permease subunit n=1 Tax=Pseudoflavonifractor phocaeensis TaxID=1870988 RepID=UPI001DBA8007|nr:hypothetical protein [Pseudoflavonifractor phocaeensis]